MDDGDVGRREGMVLSLVWFVGCGLCEVSLVSVGCVGRLRGER